MTKIKNKNILILNIIAVVSSALVITSIFFNYAFFRVGGLLDKQYISGLDILQGDDSLKVFLVITLICAAAILVVGILRILGKLNGQLFTLIFAGLSIVLMVFSKILFKEIAQTSYVDLKAGSILHLLFSIITTIACIGSFIIKLVNKPV